MLARSGLVGKNPPGPIWGHFRPIFPWAEKMQKLHVCLPIFLGGPMAAIQPDALAYNLGGLGEKQGRHVKGP